MKFSLHIYQLESIDHAVTLAQWAEKVGMVEMRISERIEHPFPVWPTLFMMAQQTQRIRLGPAVTNPYTRHPAITAKMAAYLDNYSEGRAMLGMGQGEMWQLAQLGIRPARPLQALREAVQLIRHLLSGNKDAFEGEVFSVAAGFDVPWKPYGDDIPIFIGSHSPRGMALAGETADKLDIPMCVASEVIAAAQVQLRKGMEKAGRKGNLIPLVCSPQLSLSHEREAAIKRAQHEIGRFIGWMDYPTQLMGIEPEEVARLGEAYRDGNYEYLYDTIDERYLEAFGVVGTPHEVIEHIERLAELGVEHLILNQPGPNLEEALNLLEKEVLPHFAD